VPTELTSRPFENIVSHIDNDQQAIVTGLYVKFIQNDFVDENVMIKIINLFVVNNDNDEDDNKPIKIPCPPKYHDLFTGSDELIYKPNLTQQKILMYAGQEKFLFEPTIIELLMDESEPMGSLYQDTHPLISCLVEKGMKLSEFSKTEQDGKVYYGVGNETIEKIKEYYHDTIFKNIHYTRFEDCKFECTLKVQPEDDIPIEKRKGIAILMQINYILTNQK
jgi:hypothetical protein